MDPSFVDEVLTESIKILNNSELYSKYQDERNARFKVTPRKVTEVWSDLFLTYVLYNALTMYCHCPCYSTFHMQVLYLKIATYKIAACHVLNQ